MRQQFKSPNNQRIFELFIKVIKDLNQKGVVPIIYGSLGLYLLIGEQGEIDDIDMLIEDQSFLTTIKEVSINNGFNLDPDHERELIGNNTYISFLDLNDIE